MRHRTSSKWWCPVFIVLAACDARGPRIPTGPTALPEIPSQPIPPASSPGPATPSAPNWQSTIPFVWTPQQGIRVLPLPEGALGGAASGINNRSEIIGWYSFNGLPGIHAMLWSAANGFIDLHPPGMAGSSKAVAINEKGQVLINVNSGDFEGSVLWTQAGATAVIGYQSFRYGVVGRGLNDNGDVAGHRIDYGELVAPIDAITWSHADGIKILPSFLESGESRGMAADINNFGEIVGVDGSIEAGGIGLPVATVWRVNVRSPVPATIGEQSCGKAPLDPVFDRILSCGSWALAINDAGQIAGSIDLRAFRFTPASGTTFIESEAKTVAAGINSRGDIAGLMVSGIQAHAFVWHSSGVVEVLPSIRGRSESRATAINDSGQVVGFAQ